MAYNLDRRSYWRKPDDYKFVVVDGKPVRTGSCPKLGAAVQKGQSERLKKYGTLGRVPVKGGVNLYDRIESIDDGVCGNLECFSVVNSLKERERLAVIHKFGLFGEEKKGNDFLAELFSLSKSNVGRFAATGIRQLAWALFRNYKIASEIRMLPEGEFKEAIFKKNERYENCGKEKVR